MKIEIDLFEFDEVEIIKQLDEMQNKTIKRFNNAIYDLALYGKQIVNKNASALVSGEEQADSLQNEIKKIRETKYTVSYIIYNPTQNATYAEFGTGLVGFINPYPHPTLSWRYDVNNHYEWGWYYKKDGKLKWSKGIPSQPFYFLSGEEIERISVDYVKSRLLGG